MTSRPLLLAAALAAFSLPLSAAADEAAFASCLARLRGEAAAKGVSGDTFDTHTAALAPDMAVDRLSRRPARIRHPDLGLPRRAGGRGARRRRARDAGRNGRRCSPGGASIRRGCRDGGRGVGRGEQLRAQLRQPAAAHLAVDAVLLRTAPGLLPRRVLHHAEDHAGRSRRPRAPDRLVGRRLRPYPVHALDLHAPGGGFRRRWPSRPGRQRARRARFHRQFPQARGLAQRICPGASRSPAARVCDTSRRRPTQQAADADVGRARRAAYRW